MTDQAHFNEKSPQQHETGLCEVNIKDCEWAAGDDLIRTVADH